MDIEDPAWIHYKAAMEVTKILQNAGFEAYIIGGAVRDILLGHLPKDFDLVTNAKPEEILALPELRESFYKDTAQAFGVTRVKFDVEIAGHREESEIEIATYRKDIEAHLGRKLTKVEFAGLEDDILRRDLTINSLALDPFTSQVIDLVGGIHDLERGTVRFIGNPLERIKEDPLRILRAIRLKNQFHFNYANDTKDAIAQAVTENFVQIIAPDRVRDELTRMFKHQNRSTALVDLDIFGILQIIIPEVVAMKGVQQPEEYHSEGDVFEHTILALQSMPEVVSNRLAWAVLLHDVGKIKTQEMPEETGDRIRFSGHSTEGAAMAKTILGRLNFSNKFCDEVYWMVYHHLGIDDLPNMRPMRRAQFMSHPAFLDLLELHRADAKASWFKEKDNTLEASSPDFSNLEQLYLEYEDNKTNPLPNIKEDLGVDGAWVKKEFNIEDGPVLGKILHELSEKYLDHEISTLDQAKDLAQKILGSN